MKIKMIASDMDDTLLNNDRKISPRNLAAIKKSISCRDRVYACHGQNVQIDQTICRTIAVRCTVDRL